MSERPGTLWLIWQQTRYQNKIFWRTPVAAFFTLVFPLMFLVLFTAIFGNDVIEGLGVTTPSSLLRVSPCSPPHQHRTQTLPSAQPSPATTGF